ncbi:enoyl-CoA hydratase [Myxococcota bacterium]|nr:enoyl-CoA hydratase [Myxococcota bacterium]
MSEHILSHVEDGIQTITFNRPEKKNAFTLAMYEGFVAALAAGNEDRSVRVILLKGAGDAFTAGNDLADFMTQPPTSEDTPVFKLLMALVDCPKPIIAAIDGAAVGIGTTMLLHTDLNYASDRTKFVMPFVNLGLVPEGASTFLLPRMAGHQRAAELLMFGEPFTPATAKELGIISEVLPAADFHAQVADRARRLADKPATAIRRTKRLLKEPTRDRAIRAIRAEAEMFVRSLQSPEAAEAFSAFFEKRKPDFSKIKSED